MLRSNRLPPLFVCLSLVAVLAISAAADDPPRKPTREERITKFVADSETSRQAILKAMPQRLKEARAKLANLRRATVGTPPKRNSRAKVERPHFDTKENKNAAIANIESEIAEMTERQKELEANAPPPPYTFDDEKRLEDGDIGRVEGGVKVVQVVDENNAIAEHTYCSRSQRFHTAPGVQGGIWVPDVKTHKQLVWLRGFSMKGVTDGRGFEVGCVEVTGTKTYETAVGTNTVFVLEPFDTRPHLKPAPPRPMPQPNKVKPKLS